MVGWIRIPIFYLLLAGLGSGASFGQKTNTKNLVDPTIRSDFQKRNPLIPQFTVLLQAVIHPDHELLLIGGTQKQPYRFKMGYVWLEGNELLGLYVRQHTDIPKFHPIMLDPVGGDGAGFQVDRLWFGKFFYDAEGYSGVGGFGYFDTEQRRYVLFSPPEIRNYSVSALCVTGNVLWMATHQSSEYVGYPGSLLQFEIAEKRIRSYPFESLVQQMISYKDVLYFACQEGIAVFKNRRFYRYLIDKTLDGNYQVASY